MKVDKLEISQEEIDEFSQKKARRIDNIRLTHGCRVTGEEPLFEGKARGGGESGKHIEETGLVVDKPIYFPITTVFERTGISGYPVDYHQFSPAVTPVPLVRETRYDNSGRVVSSFLIEKP